MIKVGAHVSAAVSLELSLERAKNIGAECTQIFISPPRQWAQTPHDPEEIERYREEAEKTGIGPNFIHGTYLINLGSTDPNHLQKSVEWLIYAMKLAGELGMTGVIFHLGSHKGAGLDKVLNQITSSLNSILDEATSRSYLVLENSAGAGGNIGGRFTELGKILKAVNHPQLKICLDTQHSFASGYNLKTPEGLENALKEFNQEIGLDNLVAIHANDSKVELGAGKDRHENIGEGFIGKEGFENIINHPSLKNLPFILEVPGFANSGPEEQNIKLLKSLIH